MRRNADGFWQRFGGITGIRAKQDDSHPQAGHEPSVIPAASSGPVRPGRAIDFQLLYMH
jgi:hypothetical protein